MAGITRFGDRIERGAAASFRCARCGEVAGIVRVACAGATVNMGPIPGDEVTARNGKDRSEMRVFRDGLRVGLVPGSRYLSESVNLAHAPADTLSVKPSRSVVSRTRITPTPLAASTQALPDVPE
jgi:hypothetical protein